MIFGKRGCDEERKKEIKLVTSDECQYTIAEQLTEKEAEEYYKEFKDRLQDKNLFIEVEYTCYRGYPCKKILSKSHIVSVCICE